MKIKNKILFFVVGIITLLSITGFVSAAPYSTSFDVRNMVGFNDGAINANDISAYIQARNPSSPMINEAGIGQNIINSGLSNNVNPAFLVATAKLEGQFGTAGWASKYPYCHNTMGYGIPSGSTPPNSINCMSRWGDMINRVAYNIAYGSYYYKSGRYTVSQIRNKYAGQPNSQSIADIMNDLYNFAQSRHTTTCTSQCSSGQIRCNGNYKQSCVYSNGCWIWGGNTYCNNGCVYGQCIIQTCTPKTCSQLGKNCGAWDNGCQQSINCGSCASGQTCSNGVCVNSNPTCTPNWQCGSWSSCIYNQQTRSCTDSNNCGTNNGKPSVSQSCNSNPVCISQCSLGQTRCSGQNSETCRDYNNDGCYEWGGGVSCNNGCHGNGFCNSCIPNSKYCDGNYLETCNSDGSGSSGIMCLSGQTCSNGQCISNTNTCSTCQSLNYKCGDLGFSNGCPTIHCGDCPYPQYCRLTDTAGSSCINQ